MTVNVGVMELPVTEDPDPVRTYLNGTHPSGGLWTALTRASNHDHSGGLSGVQLGATSIPDGSITTTKLDPSVLLPYALTDGSKPFTGQVSMNADAIVRDALYFGEQGSAGAADASIARTGAGALRVDNNLGVGVTPAAWAAGYIGLHIGREAVLMGAGSAPTAKLMGNSYYDGTAFKALATGPATRLEVESGAFSVATAPSVAAGAAQTFTARASIAPTGTLTLTPDAATNSLVWGNGRLGPGNGAAPRVFSGAGQHLELYGESGSVTPNGDGGNNMGAPSVRWGTVYAITGTISTSSQEYKEGITPLDPAACYQAAKDVRWYEYAYLPPAYTEPPETEGQEPEERERQVDEGRAAHARMLVETAPARHQRGFVFPAGADTKDELGGALPPVPDLFGLSDRQSTTPQADLATLGCALQEVIRRLETLEGAPAA
jgi:hypothetical protein